MFGPRRAAPRAACATYRSPSREGIAITTRAIRLRRCGARRPRAARSARIYGDTRARPHQLILRGKRIGLFARGIGELLDLYAGARNERAQLSSFLAMRCRPSARLPAEGDIDATLVRSKGVERECRGA